MYTYSNAVEYTMYCTICSIDMNIHIFDIKEMYLFIKKRYFCVIFKLPSSVRVNPTGGYKIGSRFKVVEFNLQLIWQ